MKLVADDLRSQNALSKAEFGRMPWHDVAMGVIGDCVYDIAEHFVLVSMPLCLIALTIY